MSAKGTTNEKYRDFYLLCSILDSEFYKETILWLALIEKKCSSLSLEETEELKVMFSSRDSFKLIKKWNGTSRTEEFK